MPSPPELDEIGTEIQNLERLLVDLRDRYHQIQVDEPLRSQLQAQIATQQQIKAKPDQKSDLKAELAKLSDQLDEVDVLQREHRVPERLALNDCAQESAADIGHELRERGQAVVDELLVGARPRCVAGLGPVLAQDHRLAVRRHRHGFYAPRFQACRFERSGSTKP